MNHPLNQQDKGNFTKAIKRAKWKSTFRTTIISLLVTVIVLFGAMIGNAHLASWSAERVSKSENALMQITGPNEVVTARRNNSGFLSGTLQTYTAKVIEGAVVPWSHKETKYNVFPFLSFTSLSGSINQSLSVPDADMQENSYEYNRSFNGLSGQREMLFYIPSIDYNDKILNDLPLLQEMNPAKLVEMAISFDKDYSLSEVKQLIPPGLTQTWYWVDTYDNKKYLESYIDGNGNKSYSTPFSESWVHGFGINLSSESSMEVTEQKFLDALEAGVRLEGNHHYDFNRIYNYLKKDKEKPDASDIRVLGVVVTGTAEELRVLSDEPYVRGVTLGAVADKY
ncbi:anti-sigma factor [Paenibacillus dakarensis]|uniref:anti-sigma factor n=1 Tax=Paenibacillus dakarensis TaxID=1527293 RepID=UPI0006D55B15|nr:anti-sigma factor [Paenibacillus dakarensis]